MCSAWTGKPFLLNAELLLSRQQFSQHQYDRISQVYIDQFHIRIADVQRLSGKRQYSMYKYTQLCRKPPQNPQKLARKSTRYKPRSSWSQHRVNNNNNGRERSRRAVQLVTHDQSDQSRAFRWKLSKRESVPKHDFWLAAKAAIWLDHFDPSFCRKKCSHWITWRWDLIHKYHPKNNAIAEYTIR